tara:strand:+ start:230 stop:547 length:318 start_codon:yes stop_codon:yes gene_type:complete
MLNMNEIDFLVDTECKSFASEQLERFEILDNSNVHEINQDEGFTMLFFESKISAVLAYNRLVNFPESRLLWDLSQEQYVIDIKNDWLKALRNQENMKIPSYKASK